MYYLQSRYYDPKIGRFINADVYTSTGQGVIGNNMFAYCLNNPVNSYDSSGTIAISYCNDDWQSFLDNYYGCSGGGAGGYSGATSLFVSYVATAAVVDGITTTGSGLGELIDTIVDKLSKSLAKSGRAEYRNEFEEHHIAAKKASNAKQAASILDRVLPGGVEDPLNKVMLKTSVHRRIHTNAYYMLVNYAVIAAYDSANGNPQKQAENVTNVLGALNVFLTGLNVLSTN